ncbi:hypothetical protein Dimus_010918 [Dionaea muscipula]
MAPSTVMEVEQAAGGEDDCRAGSDADGATEQACRKPSPRRLLSPIRLGGSRSGKWRKKTVRAG